MILRDPLKCTETAERQPGIFFLNNRPLPFLPLSAEERKQLRQLHSLKGRLQHNFFLIEGFKPVMEMISAGFSFDRLLIGESALPLLAGKAAVFAGIVSRIRIVRDRDIATAGTLTHPEGFLAVAGLPDLPPLQSIIYPAIFLQEVNDPGNLGSVIRTAAWYGIGSLVLSPGSADPYNPKVVRTSMGMIFRVNISHNVLFGRMADIAKQDGAQIFGTTMSGEWPVKSRSLQWIAVLGNESRGLPDEILSQCTTNAGIPRQGYGDSLNLGVSAGILINQLMT